MSTARGASAARRDGEGAAPRSTDRPRGPRARAVSGVCSAAAVSVGVALAAAACASAPTHGPDVNARLLPGNQDTAAAARNLPVPPRAQAQLPNPAARAMQAPVAPPTSTASPGSYGTDPLAAAKAMATVLINTRPNAELTPQQNTAGSATTTTSLPPLEVITMPMWLWVDSPGSLVVKVSTTDQGDIYVVDTVVVDEVQWFLDGATTPWMTCGSKTQPVAPAPTTANAPSSGPGVPYASEMDPGNAHDAQPLACVNQGFAQPYYQPTTLAGATTTVDGVHKLQAAVFWHVDYEYYDTSGYPVFNGYGPASAMNIVPVMSANTLTFRVGEIQALVTQP